MFYYLLTHGISLIYHSISERIFCIVQPNTVYILADVVISFNNCLKHVN